MADLTKSLLDAISIIADKTVDEISSDETIKAAIKKIVNTSEGKYLVNYNNGDFYAYKQSGSTDLYQVGEYVYILIPKGDMSQKKFIIGRVEDDKKYSAFKTLTSSLLNDYVIIGDNAIIEKEYYVEKNKLNVERMQPLKLNSYKINDFRYCYLYNPSNIDNLPETYDTIENKIVDIDKESFNNSAKQAEAILIRAKFKADLNTDNIGNYGIIVNIAFADETNPQIDEKGNTYYPPKLVAYTLDTSKMTGNPLKFYDYISQYIVAPFDGENYLYIDSIIAFSEGFVSQNKEIPKSGNEDPYINIDGLEIIALTEISAVVDDYKLKLTAPQGNTVRLGEEKDLKIKATMTYLNQDIIKDTVFYWGIKDPSVTPTHNKYHAKLGSGYRYIDTTNKDELILSSDELTAAENIFACVAIYESDIILKTSISLYNNNNRIEITIDSDQGIDFQFNEGNPTLTCLINRKTSNYQEDYPDSAFSFIWTKEDAESGTILLNETETQLEKNKEKELQECYSNYDGISSSGRTVLQILSYYSTRISQIKDVSYPNGVNGSKITCKLKSTNVYTTYTCSVYRSGVYIGYGSITLHNSKKVINNNYYITITNGNQVFQYDESGIAPNSIKQQEPIEVLDLTAVFYSPQGIEVTPKRIRWIVPQGKTLIDIPSLGLQTDLDTGERYYVGNIYPLSIKEVYDNNCGNNQIVAVVTHADGTEYRQSTNLLFTKIGEIGTNGTDTVLKINEAVATPFDECLTIIKTAETEKYNSGDNTSSIALNANLYTNNNQILGHTTKWTIAGTSDTQSLKYQVESTEDNSCIVGYYNNDDDSKLDTRIIKAQTSLNGKYFYSFYGIPAIEYQNNYTDKDYKIKIMRDGTLKTVLYDSSGMNPTYNVNQGVHIELPEWSEKGYLEWTVESGAKEDGEYKNPNLLLSKTPKAKRGSKELKTSDNIEDIESLILNIQNVGAISIDSATPDIKNYINNFLVDIEKMVTDNLLTVSNKVSFFRDRLTMFKNGAIDQTNAYIKIIHDKYFQLFEQINEEYELCKNINAKYSDIYNNVQTIWNSEWPNVITDSRLNLLDEQQDQNISNWEELIRSYQEAYNDRSNDELDAITMPDRTIFTVNFRNILTILDNHYNNYLNFSGNQNVQFHPILIEYTKILMAYIKILVDETQNYFINEDEIENKYSFAYSDWSSRCNQNEFDSSENDLLTDYMIGRNIYEILSSSEENIANIYDNIRKLYQYYQMLYLNVKKYQIVEESEILNVWSKVLNGEELNLLNQIYVIPNETFNGLYMNNNIVGTVFIKNITNEKVEIAKIYIPIIMTLNTYELAALNGWDGTNIEIGEDHIMTPQIGAGIKDDTTNTFTGMVMGVVSNSSNENNNSRLNKANKVGLMGYANGKQSVFIDSKTGTATFGLPEDDTQLNENEGRIELVPGGVSKIGNWKIGNRFLYNIVNGSYERRKDIDSNASHTNSSKLMVPHNKHGIILSSDQPYVHIKGEVYEDENLNGINYEDEYNNINPGDSLELRMDPGNKSLFSIVQHTSGFGDEDIEDLCFGYKVDGSDSITVIRSYVSNQNTGEQNENSGNAEYYIYRLDTDSNGNYKPFYSQEDLTGIVKWDTWTESFNNIVEQNISLNTVLPLNNFQSCVSINENTGVITYNPANLVWQNTNDWQSVTEETSSTSNISVVFRYNKNINTPLEQSFSIGQIKNTSGYKIYKLTILGVDLQRELSGINLDNFTETFIRFYVVPNNGSGNITDALLMSEEINIWENQDDVNVELFSINNAGLLNNNVYILKAELYINNYIINSDCFYTLSSSSSSYKIPSAAPYGTFKITGAASSMTNFNTTEGFNSRLSGQYKFNNNILEFKIFSEIANDSSTVISNYETYDFVLWKQGNDNIQCAGQVMASGSNAKFFTTTPTKLNNLPSTITLNAASSNNPWCISFYPRNSFTVEDTEQNVTNTYGNSANNTTGTTIDTITMNSSYNESTDTLTIWETTGTITESDNDTVNNMLMMSMAVDYWYSYDASRISLSDKQLYYIDWNNNNYNDIQASWSLNLNFDFGDIQGAVPASDSSNKLCIQENNSARSIQGIPYAKTYWRNNNQRVKFYKEYYDWVNDNTNSKIQYGYIDVQENNDIYYKYIKTLVKKDVNDWFINSNSNYENSGQKQGSSIWTWIDISTSNDILKKAIYWKEFIRVGLDENGRFFSAGLQDKKAYTRTGRIYGFGKAPNLYGQEIRIQQFSNNYLPIIKMFTSLSDINTTYITQGRNDNGNISIRTAENNHYVELAASQFYDSEDNLIPEKANFVKVSYNNGVELKANNKIEATTDELLASINRISMSSSENEKYKIEIIDDGNIKVKTPIYIVSSTSNNSLNGTTNNTNDYGHYRIKGFIDETDNIKKPKIQLWTGSNNVGIDISPDLIKLQAKSGNTGHFIEINAGDQSTSRFTIKNMELSFNANDNIVKLQNTTNTYIQINPSEIILQSGSTNNNNITINGITTIAKQLTVLGTSDSTFNGNLNINDKNLTIGRTLSLGKQNKSYQNAYIGGILNFYKSNTQYIQISPSILEQLFTWYNTKRWGIGCYNNTLYLRNIGNSLSPEGSGSSTSYSWTMSNFTNYIKTD